MAEQLTWQQKLAVENRGGKLLVSAAAGSGKTKVLVERILGYITDPQDPANIDDFLVITYTKAAAAELRGKIAKALTQRIADDPANLRLQQQFQRLYLAKISTVHSFCCDVLRENAHRLDISGDFRMAEEKECIPLRQQVVQKLLSEVYDSLADDPNVLAFVETQGINRNDSELAELILKVYDSALCHKDPKGWLDKCVADSNVCGVTDASQTVWGRFLMDDLFSCIDMHSKALSLTAQLCRQSEGLEIMAEFLDGIAHQLSVLRQAETWDEISRNQTVNYYNLTCLNRVKKDAEVYAKAKEIRSACSAAITKRLKPFGNDSSQVLADMEQIAPAVQGLVTLVEAFTKRYDRVKRALRIMDFSDLEHKALDLFLGKSRGGPTAVAREVGSHYREILVDEYQDSNEVQDGIFSALTSQSNNLFMVGDVKQSIYQFRLADPGIFLDKYARYQDPEFAQAGEGRKIVLSNNFRSCKAVIGAVNDVFSHCMSPRTGGLAYGDEEALWEGCPHEPVDEQEIELHVISTSQDVYSEEAEFVAQRIVQLLDGTHFVRGEGGLRPIQPEDIVILLRSPKTNAWDFRYALHRKGLRTVSSKGIDLLQTPEVEWLRSLLHTINNPRQDILLLGALAGPVFGFTADDLATVRRADSKACIYDALCTMDWEKAQSFVQVIETLRQTARMHTLPELIEKIFALTRADAVYAAMPNGQERSMNLQDFYQFVAGFDASGTSDLQQLLQYLQISEEKGLEVGRETSTAGCIQITSIHKSKGLEYPVVFLCGTSRRFNMKSAAGNILAHQDLGLGMNCINPDNRTRYPSISKYAIAAKIRQESVSEELRILYVAMTRPKDRLIMTYAARNAHQDLEAMTARMDVSEGELICAEAGCLGDWILYTAMSRMEAGQLFQQSVRPANLRICDDPWHITYRCSDPVEPDDRIPDMETGAVAPENLAEDLNVALSFSYSNLAATRTPSKQTATQLKGRVKDAEASENTPAPPRIRQWRKPSFSRKSADGREYGNAMHAFLQHVRYAACDTADGIALECDRLVREGFLTADQGAMVDGQKVFRFFSSELGSKLRNSASVLREFKFSILSDAKFASQELAGEKILIQGVVDCAVIEPDGITVVDFKTDYVTEETLPLIVNRYTPQVEAYADALSRIYQLPIKGKALYLFGLDRIVWI